MAREFDAAQLEYLQGANVTSEFGIALCCWFKCNDVTGNYTLMWTGDSTVNNHGFGLYAMGGVAGDFLEALIADGGVPRTAQTIAGYTAGVWHHACAIWSFGPGIGLRVFLDGGNRGVGAAFDEITENAFSIAVAASLVKAGYFDGCIAEVAVYTLDYLAGANPRDKMDNFEANVLPSLAAGYSPLLCPLGLTACWPLVGALDRDIVGGYNLTPFNTPSIASHPRIILPQSSQLTTPKRVLPSFGKFKSQAMLTGQMKSQTALSGQLKSEPKTTGKFETFSAEE